MEKFFDVCINDPMIPLSMGSTVGFLCAGVRDEKMFHLNHFLFVGLKFMKSNNSYMSQMMMRGRVASQFVAIASCMYAVNRRREEREALADLKNNS